MSYAGRKIGIIISLFIIVVIHLYIEYSLSVWIGWVLSILCVISSLLFGRKVDFIITQTNQDSLTGLYNRKFIEESFPKLKSLASRNNSKLFIFVIDCNNFKGINDQYGHIKGDVILQSIANILTNNFRHSDLISRWGGDEFLVIGQLSNEKAIPVMISRIQIELSKLSESVQTPISISIGYSIFPDDHVELEQLFHFADINMYNQKNQYK